MLKTIKKVMALVMVFTITMIISMPLHAQDEGQQKKKKEKPVRSPWASPMLIETQTGVVLRKKTLEFDIQHRFGNINSESFDLLGIYGASNIRLGLSYGLFKNFQIGIGTTKNNKYQDLNWKYKILTQTRSNSIPLSLAYYGDMAIKATENEDFGNAYRFVDRISYFHEIILGRKFSRHISLQLTFQYSHYNFVDTTAIAGIKHDNFGLGFGGRIKISPQGSIVFEYDQPFNAPDKIQPNLSLGMEIATSGHVFQIFITTYQGIIPQENLAYNTNAFYKGYISLGFNISRLWGF